MSSEAHLSCCSAWCSCSAWGVGPGPSQSACGPCGPGPLYFCACPRRYVISVLPPGKRAARENKDHSADVWHPTDEELKALPTMMLARVSHFLLSAHLPLPLIITCQHGSSDGLTSGVIATWSSNRAGRWKVFLRSGQASDWPSAQAVWKAWQGDARGTGQGSAQAIVSSPTALLRSSLLS